MTFAELMKRPLASTVSESAVNEECSGTMDPNKTEDVDDMELGVGASEEPGDDMSDDELEKALAGMSDEELDNMASDIIDSEIEDIIGDVPEEELDEDETRMADDMMAVAATTSVIQSELNADEKAALAESLEELRIAVDEGFLMESDIEALRSSLQPFTEAAFAAKTKMKMSAQDRMKQLYALAINVSAKAHDDPDYKKYQKICKLKRIYRAKFEKKYHAEATRRMKVYFKRLKASKSGILSKIGKALDKDNK